MRIILYLTYQKMAIYFDDNSLDKSIKSPENNAIVDAIKCGAARVTLFGIAKFSHLES